MFSLDRKYMDPVQTYNFAIKLRTEGRVAEAARQYEALLHEYPYFENGHANYDLAGCYEDLGEYAKADRQNREGLSADPQNLMFLGGLASFTLLHGDPNESLQLHLKLLQEDDKYRNPAAREELLTVIRDLAVRTGAKLEDLR
jgi:tetratricopeptide (TPR) repeat protein